MITETPVAGKPLKTYRCRACGALGVAGPDNPPDFWVSLRTTRQGRRVLVGSFCSRQCVVDFVTDLKSLAPRPS